MKKIHCLLLACFFVPFFAISQSVGIGTPSPHASAQLEVNSNSKGFLLPRMTTTERDAINSPAVGLQVYNLSTHCIEIFINGYWQSLVCGCTTAPGAPPNAAMHVSTSSQVAWNWNTVAGATGYKYNSTNNYATATDNGLSNTRIQTGLLCTGGPNELYVWAYNACGNSPSTKLSAFLNFPVMINKTGSGNGTVTSTNGDINCGITCNTNVNCGTTITLTAVADNNSVFTGWSGGGCTGTGPCVTTVNNSTNITASFVSNYLLSVNKTGNGSGQVTSSPAAINCGTTCTGTFTEGTMVSLTATPSNGSTFTGWSGACTGTGSCMVTMNNDINVAANFSLNTFLLSVSKTGAGTGTVTSSPAGISCGVTCSQSYNYGTMVTLTATPAPGSSFAGWSGACSGTGSCNVTMDAAKSVTAIFQ